MPRSISPRTRRIGTVLTMTGLAATGLTVTSAAVLAAVAVPVAPAHAAPPTPALGPGIDNYAGYDPQDTCDPSATPGVTAFRDLINSAYGKRDSGISRGCSDHTSEHHEGRALDWMINADDGAQEATADDLLTWLLATDQHGNPHANARRLGIMYIIWDRQIWASYRPTEGWRPYSCDGTAGDCHTNHIHFSFSWAGARKQTSWWQGSAANGPNGTNGLTAGDVTGDGRADIFGRLPDGTLKLYPNTGNDTAPYAGTGTVIGTGWNGLNWFLAEDVTGDARADLVGTQPDGTLRLYPNTGNPAAPYAGTGTVIGTAWHTFSHVVLTDVTGDRRADLVAVQPDGALRLYPNTGNPAAPYTGTGTVIGTGWTLQRLLGGDVTGDGRADLVGLRTDGTLRLYPNTGNPAAPYTGTGTVIGNGWTGFADVQLGDVTGDGRPDLLGAETGGNLKLYTHTRNNSAPYARTGTVVGYGWQMFVQ